MGASLAKEVLFKPQALRVSAGVVLVRRPGLPLTPAAEFFCDVLLREVPLAAPG